MIIDILGWDRTWPYLLAALLGGYFCGSLPFGLLVARVLGAGDLRQTGSGNIGTINMLRTAGPGAAALTLGLDLGKGLLPTLLASTYWGPLAASAAGLGAVAGHCLPVWLRFRGGKGVATGLGAILIWNPLAALGGLLVWILLAAAFRIASLASLAATLAAILLLVVFREGDYMPAALVVGLLIWLRHAANIGRLVRGKELRIRLFR